VFERFPAPTGWHDSWPLAEGSRADFWLGRLSEGRASLEELRRRFPSQASLYEAWWTHPPLVAASAVDLRRLRTELEALSPDLSAWAHWEADVWRQVRLLLLGSLSVRLEDFSAAARYASTLEALPGQGLDASHGYGADVYESWARVGSQTVRAMAARAQGRTREALQRLESVEPEMFGFPLWARVAAFPDVTLQRFLRAELLRELGRDEEALAWYPYSVSHQWITGSLFLPLSHLRMAEIHDRRGNREAAIHHYTLFTLLWRDADAELRPLVERASRRSRRSSRSARRRVPGTDPASPGIPG
jgi:hypothetical protein